MWQRKGGGGDYKTLKQHISNTGKLARGVKPKSVSQTLASGILPRKKSYL